MDEAAPELTKPPKPGPEHTLVEESLDRLDEVVDQFLDRIDDHLEDVRRKSWRMWLTFIGFTVLSTSLGLMTRDPWVIAFAICGTIAGSMAVAYDVGIPDGGSYFLTGK